VVFKVSPTGTETVLHFFTRLPDGRFPHAGLIRDAAGNLYGTTEEGGIGYGTVFKLDATGTESVLHSFTGTAGRDGELPFAGLIQDASGNLYGTTVDGGSPGIDVGVVFELSPGGSETVLYQFGELQEANPEAGLIRDAVGNLYGTTFYGASGACFQGCGTVFELSPNGIPTILHQFAGPPTDGGRPTASLIRDIAGNFYGTTYNGGGGSSSTCDNGSLRASGCGVVFKLSPSGTEDILHSFTGGGDGANPCAGLIRDAAGNLYGTAAFGGAHGFGVVFELIRCSSSPPVTTLRCSIALPGEPTEAVPSPV
jgi:uncharacterized repeat protein (TIGR03803 family)